MPTDVLLEGNTRKQFQKAPDEVQKKLRHLAERLSQDPQHGEYVAPAQVPNKATITKWVDRVGPVTNLYKLELPHAWRALYTVGSRGSDRVVLVLEVVSHKAYDRIMGYG